MCLSGVAKRALYLPISRAMLLLSNKVFRPRPQHSIWILLPGPAWHKYAYPMLDLGRNTLFDSSGPAPDMDISRARTQGDTLEEFARIMWEQVLSST